LKTIPAPWRLRALTLLAPYLILLAATPSVHAEELLIRFVSPPAGRPVSGETKVTLRASVPGGARLVRIEVFIDSQRVAVLEKPPYEFIWNAGEEFLPHKLMARATDDAGRTAETTLETPPLHIGQRETVALVNLYLNVFDDKGKPITDLVAGDFKVYEDGQPQALTTFTGARQPLSVALVMDTSNSMGTGNRMEIARKAGADFIKRMASGDRALVVQFNDAVQEVQPLTDDRKKLIHAVESLMPSGGTALYDALFQVSRRLSSMEGRKALVLLSDGRDQAFQENSPGSLHRFEECVDAAVRSEAVVYSIGLGARLEDETDLAQTMTLRRILETFSEKTGGRFYNPERAGQLEGVYQQISEDLGRQYTLAYSPRNEARDGRWRVVRVEVARTGARVVTRPGYFAPLSP
jgi:VWFA-related protein